MNCNRCQQENPDDGLFCLACGAELVIFCMYCRAQNPVRGLFCWQCGKKQEIPSGQPTPPPKSPPPRHQIYIQPPNLFRLRVPEGWQIVQGGYMNPAQLAISPPKSSGGMLGSLQSAFGAGRLLIWFTQMPPGAGHDFLAQQYLNTVTQYVAAMGGNAQSGAFGLLWGLYNQRMAQAGNRLWVIQEFRRSALGLMTGRERRMLSIQGALGVVASYTDSEKVFCVVPSIRLGLMLSYFNKYPAPSTLIRKPAPVAIFSPLTYPEKRMRLPRKTSALMGCISVTMPCGWETVEPI